MSKDASIAKVPCSCGHSCEIPRRPSPESAFSKLCLGLGGEQVLHKGLRSCARGLAHLTRAPVQVLVHQRHRRLHLQVRCRCEFPSSVSKVAFSALSIRCRATSIFCPMPLYVRLCCSTPVQPVLF